MPCKTVLIAGVFYAIGCNGPAEASEKAEVAPLEQGAPEQLAAAASYRGKRTGWSLQNLVDDIKWREKTFSKLASR